MMKITLNDRLFLAAVFFIIICSSFSVFRTYELNHSIISGAPVVDISLIEKQEQSGNLSLHEAEFYKDIDWKDGTWKRCFLVLQEAHFLKFKNRGIFFSPV